MEKFMEFVAIFVITLAVIGCTIVIAYDVRDHQDCDKKKGAYSRGVCFKKELIQE